MYPLYITLSKPNAQKTYSHTAMHTHKFIHTHDTSKIGIFIFILFNSSDVFIS